MLQVLSLILITIGLVSCYSGSRRDGPPSFYVDARRIPNAVPKIEPLSRIGNKRYYTVFGQRYSVMKTSFGYNQNGIASWYGTKFHSRYTSNGERYDMLAMTAAHKSLPLPTYVQVTNLRNGKKIIVKVNDRGPFEGNRIIDLSYVAAKKLGMLGHGTTMVNVKSIDPRDALLQAQLAPRIRHVTTTHYVAHGKTPLNVKSIDQHDVLQARLTPRTKQVTTHYVAHNYYVPRQHVKTIVQTKIKPSPKHIVKQQILVKATPKKRIVTVKTHVIAKAKFPHRSINDIQVKRIKQHKPDVYIQVGSYPNRDKAHKLKKRLLTYTESPVQIHSSANKYNVQIGPLKDMATAAKISKRLKSAGIPVKSMGKKGQEIFENFDIT